MNATVYASSLVTICLLAQCFGQGTFEFNITFAGPPFVEPGAAIIVQEYSEAGMLFTPIDPNAPWHGFVRRGAATDPRDPDNGTAFLQAPLGSTLLLMRPDGSVFDVLSVDLAEYSTVVPNAVTVHFVGYRLDGSTVRASLTTDGVIDGTGPVPDFQTFYFGPQFSGLTRVEIPTYGWSLDNLVVSVPEPNSGALLLVGAALIALRRCKR